MKTKAILYLALLGIVQTSGNLWAQNQAPQAVVESFKSTSFSCDMTPEKQERMLREREKVTQSQDKHLVPILPVPPCLDCNDAMCRDMNYDLSNNTDWIRMHLRIFLYRNDDRDEQFDHLTIEQLVAKTNADFAQAFIEFSYEVVYVDENDVKKHNSPFGGAIFDPEVINVVIRGINETADVSRYWNIGGSAGNPIMLTELVLPFAATSYTLTHELGHNFGLSHVFANTNVYNSFPLPMFTVCGPTEDFPGAPNQDTRGDFCADTPPTLELGGTDATCNPSLYGYPCNATNASETWVFFDGINLADNDNDNYMQYGNPPTCKTTFTPNQIARMRCFINSSHYLQHQTDWVTTNGFFDVPFADMQASQEHALVGQAIQFRSRASSTTASYLWNFDVTGSGPTSSLANPTHVYTAPGYYTVSLTVFDAMGNSWVQEIVDYVKVNAVGFGLPYTENFDGSTDYPNRDWYVVKRLPAGTTGSDDYYTWTGVRSRDDFRPYIDAFYPPNTATGGYNQRVIGSDGSLTAAMYVNNQGNTSTLADVDNLISPDINLIPPGTSCFLDPVLEFEISYVPVSVLGAANCNMTYAVPPGTPVPDIPNFAPGWIPEKRLDVLASTNGGTTWTSIYSRAGAGLHTIPGTCSAFAFTPSAATQWRREVIHLDPFMGNSNVRFNFELSGDPYSNALYMDNVTVRDGMAPNLGPDLVVCRPTLLSLGSGITMMPGYTYAWYKLNPVGMPGPVLSTSVPFSVNANWPTTILGRTYRLCVTRTSTGCTVCDDVRINTTTCVADAEAGLEEADYFGAFEIVPNPGSGIFELHVNDEIINQTESIEVLNMLGEKMLELDPHKAQSQVGVIPFQLTNIPKGVYIVRLKGESEQWVRKLVLQ